MSKNQSLFAEITPGEETNLSGGYGFYYPRPICNTSTPSISEPPENNTGTVGTNNGISVGTNNGNIISIVL